MADQFADKAYVYLEKHRVFDLFSSLMQSLVVEMPTDPLKHLIAVLEKPLFKPRVIISGAPGSQAVSLAKTLSEELGLVLLVPPQASGDSKAEVPPAQLAKQLKEQTSRPDSVAQGWVLVNAPSSREQAQALSEAGVLPTHFLMLQQPHVAAQERYLKSEFKGTSAGAEDTEPVDLYYKLVPHLIDAYKAVFHAVDAAQQDAQVAADARAVLARLPVNRAPARPLRVSILGAKGSGKATQAALVASTFGPVHISTGAVLREARAVNAPGERGKAPVALDDKIRSFVDSGTLVPDSIVIPLVLARLNESDCRRQGWVLDGFPRTAAQGEALEKAGQAPHRVLMLDLPAETTLARATAAAVATKSGASAAALKSLVSSFMASHDELTTMYKPVLRVVDATKPQAQVTAVVEEVLRGTVV